MYSDLRHILQTLLLICLSVQVCYGHPLTADTQSNDNKVLPACKEVISTAATPQLMAAVTPVAQPQCIENYGYCMSAAECCSKRCLTYAAKCVPSGALARLPVNDLKTSVENK